MSRKAKHVHQTDELDSRFGSREFRSTSCIATMGISVFGKGRKKNIRKAEQGLTSGFVWRSEPSDHILLP